MISSISQNDEGLNAKAVIRNALQVVNYLGTNYYFRTIYLGILGLLESFSTY